MTKTILILSCVSILLIALAFTSANSTVQAIELTPFVPTATLTRTPSPTPTIFIQPWHTPTMTPTRTPHPDCQVLIYCKTPTSND